MCVCARVNLCSQPLPRKLPPLPAAVQRTTPEPLAEEKFSRLHDCIGETAEIVDSTLWQIGDSGFEKVPSLTATGPPDPADRLKCARPTSAVVAARENAPEWERPRSAPSTEILIEKFVVGTNKTVKRDWQLLEQPEQQEEEGEDTLESLARKEAKEAGRKLLTEGVPDETALVEVDVENDTHFIPLPNGAENAGGRGERGFVTGFRVY